MDELSTTHWVLLGIGSFIMGMSKGGIPGAGNLTVAIYALVLEDALGPVRGTSICWLAAPSLNFSR